MNILLLDIETAPNTAHVWGLWQQNVSINQLMESSYVMCWSAKWLGDNNIFFSSVHGQSPKRMLKQIHSLLNMADAVIHYNGSKFDIPTLNKEFLLYGMPPPAPYKQIDLLKVARNQFKFPSNKLDYVAQALGLGAKTKHIGHELWIRCMNNDDEAWEMMEEYNINDVQLLEKVYHRMLPWIRGHINYSLYSDDRRVCPNCGSPNLQKRGFHHTLSSRFQRYMCKECGHWSKDNRPLNRTEYKMNSI